MIQILESQVVDQIAAGEVVDRPAHMVKELCENSLDAGATEITIEFRSGGRDVTVKDNGCGMSAEDLKLSLLRHATSKISTADDLWKISSYGFRGEALASIGAVSQLQITSRTKDMATGFQIENNFGKICNFSEVGADLGTTISVRNLFENVPARLKFLKSEAGEHSAIKIQLKALALTHPQTSFRILQNSELIFFWPATDSVQSRIESLLEVAPLYQGRAEFEGYSAQVYVSSPNDTIGQSRQIWLFVRNRFIQDRGLQAAVLEAYRQLLMHGEYPYAAVFLDCDPTLVDVNVSPTKSQVKFQSSSSAFRAVQRAVRGVLERAPWLAHISAAQSKTAISQATHTTEQQTMTFQAADFTRTFTRPKESYEGFQLQETREVLNQLDTIAPSLKTQVDSSGDSSTNVSKVSHWSSFEVLGQAAQTYILTQNQNGLLIVDQHAAHERVVFEKLMAGYKSGQVEVQNFLLPLQVKLTEEGAQLIMQHQSELMKMGLHLEQIGPEELAVTAAPAIVKSESLTPLLERLAEDFVTKGGSFHFERVIGDLLATLACHSAVRAGQTLNLEEMKSLLEQMDEFPLSSFCPHGRPVFVEYPFRKLEKDFGRLV